jgi:hypothetical protein
MMPGDIDLGSPTYSFFSGSFGLQVALSQQTKKIAARITAFLPKVRRKTRAATGAGLRKKTRKEGKKR